MKKTILSLSTLLWTTSSWADIIIKHQAKATSRYEHDFILTLSCLVALLVINSGVILYLKRKTK